MPPASTSSNPDVKGPRWPWVLIIGSGGLVGVFAIVLRIWGVKVGVVYGPEPVRNIEGVVLAGVLAIVAGVIAIS